MDVTQQLRAWGSVHAQAQAAERAVRQAGPNGDTRALQREAQSLREHADRLHRAIYSSLGEHGR